MSGVLAGEHEPAPLLVLARCGARNQLTTKIPIHSRTDPLFENTRAGSLSCQLSIFIDGGFEKVMQCPHLSALLFVNQDSIEVESGITRQNHVTAGVIRYDYLPGNVIGRPIAFEVRVGRADSMVQSDREFGVCNPV